MTSSSIYISIALALGSGVAALGLPHWLEWPTHGRLTFGHGQCKHLVKQSSFSYSSRSSAETRAFAAWQKKAGASFGNEYASWHNARGRRIVCEPKNNYTHKCTIQAIPCQGNTRIARQPLMF